MSEKDWDKLTKLEAQLAGAEKLRGQLERLGIALKANDLDTLDTILREMAEDVGEGKGD